MMVRWQTIDYATSTLDGVKEVTTVGVYALDEEIPEVKPHTRQNGEWLDGNYNFSARGPVNVTKDKYDSHLDEVIAVVIVRFHTGIPTVYQLRCINAWILDDNANTIDKIVYQK